MKNLQQNAAFPITAGGIQAEGMSKREYLAAKALQGLLASGHHMELVNQCQDSDCWDLASMAVDLADALVTVLKEKEQK